jgi:hypothetical protein
MGNDVGDMGDGHDLKVSQLATEKSKRVNR